MRDSQRQKCYDAETAAELKLTTAGPKDKVDPAITDFYRQMPEAECTEFVNEVAAKLDLEVKKIAYPADGRKATWFQATKTVRLPPWARTKDTVVHELAHAKVGMMGPKGRHFPGPSHGAEWVEQRLIMTALFGTDEIAAALRKEYLKRAARVVPSPEQAIAFLNMARRKEQPSERRIRVVDADGQRTTGRIIEWDGETLTVGSRLTELTLSGDSEAEDLSGEACKVKLVINVADLRYATFVDPDPELLRAKAREALEMLIA